MSDTDPPVATEDTTSGQAQIRTFLIADVRGYTLFTQERGDEAAAKLAAKFADIAREIVEARGGTLLELRGDEALCVFASTREAIRAAIDLQQRFVEETLDQPELPLTVGIGLDAGEAVPVHGGYRGAVLNLAARLCGQARAGEILATREVTHLARRIEGSRYEDRGSLTFKGISEPIVVVRVVPEGVDPVERLRPFAAKPPPSKRTSRRWAIGVGIAVVVALVATSIPLLTSGGDDTADINLETNSVARLDADGNVEFATPLGERPGASVIGFGSLWVVQPDRDRVARLDLEDGSIVDTIPVGPSPAGIAIGGGSVWVTNSGDGTVSRVNVESNQQSDVLEAGTGPTGLAFDTGAIWVADTLGSELLRIDPGTGEVRTTAVAGQPTSVTSTGDEVWVSVAPSAISRVDPADTSVTLRQPVGNGPTSVLSAFDSIWVANRLDGTVTRLDPSTGGIQATIPVEEGPNALVVMDDSVWVANEFADSISEIDATGNTVRGTVPLGAAPTSLAAEGGTLWLAVGPSASAHRGGTLSIASTDELVNSLDPALNVVDTEVGKILSITNDGLLAFRKVPGADGSTLVPDLAASLPVVSPDGLTYSFVLREDLRYSTGEPIRPEDFRHALERTLVVNSGEATFDSQFSSLVGAEACITEPSTCDLSRAIVVDDRTVTFRLATPDPDLPFKLAQPPAYPVPASVPAEDQGFDAVPATGPYMFAPGASSDAITLVRNPEFQEWSGAAQPDGFVDEISWVFDQKAASAFDAVAAGGVDLLTGQVRPEDLRELELEHPDRIVRAPLPYAFNLVFEVRVPPFDDARVRQALSFALDRALLAKIHGGANEHRVTCQIFPPNIQGYEPFCPYTIGTESDVWSAPNLDRARALIEDAGAAGQELTVWASSEYFGDPRDVEVMRKVTRVLEELELRPRLYVVDADKYAAGTGWPAGTSPVGPNLFHTYWAPTTPYGAGGYIDDSFRCGFAASAPAMCTEELEAEIATAQELQATDPAAAYAAWTQIEHGLVEDAVWAPLTNLIATSVVSERTENVQIHPQLGILLSRIWVQ